LPAFSKAGFIWPALTDHSKITCGAPIVTLYVLLSAALPAFSVTIFSNDRTVNSVPGYPVQDFNLFFVLFVKAEVNHIFGDYGVQRVIGIGWGL
jgi:hypothetical protein